MADAGPMGGNEDEKAEEEAEKVAFVEAAYKKLTAAEKEEYMAMANAPSTPSI